MGNRVIRKADWAGGCFAVLAVVGALMPWVTVRALRGGLRGVDHLDDYPVDRLIVVVLAAVAAVAVVGFAAWRKRWLSVIALLCGIGLAGFGIGDAVLINRFAARNEHLLEASVQAGLYVVVAAGVALAVTAGTGVFRKRPGDTSSGERPPRTRAPWGVWRRRAGRAVLVAVVVFVVVGAVISRCEAGDYTAVTVGAHHACALRDDGRVRCWGANQYGQAVPPAGEFTAIGAGQKHTCGLRTNGDIECWGRTNLGGDPEGPWTALAVGWNAWDGLRPGGSLLHWSGRRNFEGAFDAVAVGYHFSCGLHQQGAVECWGGGYDAPEGRFSAIDAFYWHVCGIRVDGTAVCWERGDPERLAAPEGRFTAVSTGRGELSCGVRADGSLACWPEDPPGFQVMDPPEGRFVEVDVGDGQACGLRTNGTITCWGVVYPNDYELSTGRVLPVVAEPEHVSWSRRVTPSEILDMHFDWWDRQRRRGGPATIPAPEAAPVHLAPPPARRG